MPGLELSSHYQFSAAFRRLKSFEILTTRLRRRLGKWTFYNQIKNDTIFTLLLHAIIVFTGSCCYTAIIALFPNSAYTISSPGPRVLLLRLEMRLLGRWLIRSAGGGGQWRRGHPAPPPHLRPAMSLLRVTVPQTRHCSNIALDCRAVDLICL